MHFCVDVENANDFELLCNLFCSSAIPNIAIYWCGEKVLATNRSEHLNMHNIMKTTNIFGYAEINKENLPFH